MWDDKIYEDYIAVFKRKLIWFDGKYLHYEELPEERLEVEIRRVRSYLYSAKKQNWYYTSWKNVDQYKAEYEYLTSIIETRYNEYRYITL